MPRFTHVLALPSVLMLAACASARMDIPAELAGVEAMPVEGRGGWRAAQRAAFGPWEATDVDRSWTKGSGWRVGVGPLGGGSDRAAQEYVFRFLEEGVEQGRIRCAAAGSRATGVSAVVDVDFAAREALECRPDAPAPTDAAAGPGTGEPEWDLVLEASRDRRLEGFLRIGEDRYAVASTGPGGRIVPVTAYGFEIREGERVVAVVETVNRGSVRLAPELTGRRRAIFAAAAAGLLLYERVGADG
ncbi:MAG TPA: hypothetical protein VMM12_09295 [Longimicrobiales bacterium]|nr:hypothetical protein [Longimicrobiales bacterium]